jgi:hypothetical protein
MKNSLRSMSAQEQVKINGEYRVSGSGAAVLGGTPIPAKGLTAEKA